MHQVPSCFQHSQRQLYSTAYFTPRRALCKNERSNQEQENTLLRLQAVRFPLTSCRQQNRPSCPTFESITTLHRQAPNYTLSYGVVMVLAQDTWFVRRSYCPALTFWKLEISMIEHGVAPTSLQQPNVGLSPIRAGGPSRLMRSRQIKVSYGHTNRSRSELTAVPCLLLLPSPPLPIQTLHCSRPRHPQFWTTLSRIHHTTSQHLPRWIFSWSGIQQSLHHQKSAKLLSNWVHGCLQVVRGYLIVYRATLLRAVRSCVRGEVIFRTNSFTENMSLACPKQRN